MGSYSSSNKYEKEYIYKRFYYIYIYIYIDREQ